MSNKAIIVLKLTYINILFDIFLFLIFLNICLKNQVTTLTTKWLKRNGGAGLRVVTTYIFW